GRRTWEIPRSRLCGRWECARAPALVRMKAPLMRLDRVRGAFIRNGKGPRSAQGGIQQLARAGALRVVAHGDARDLLLGVVREHGHRVVAGHGAVAVTAGGAARGAVGPR